MVLTANFGAPMNTAIKGAGVRKVLEAKEGTRSNDS